jgi:hypothetical protein
MTSGERRERDRAGAGTGLSGVERELRRLVPAVIPSGLRERALRRAAEARGDAALSPWMRIAAATCAALIGLVLVLDPVQRRHEEARLAALLDGRAAAPPAAATAVELAEAGLGTRIEAERWTRMHELAAAAARKPVPGANLAVLERLKGRWDYDTPEDPD